MIIPADGHRWHETSRGDAIRLSNSTAAQISRSELGRATPSALSRSLDVLSQGCRQFAQTTISQRIELLESCIQNIHQRADEWVDCACDAKGIPPGSPLRAEEILAGPVVSVRYLRLLIQSLKGIESRGVPPIPGRVVDGYGGQLHVPIFPSRKLYDRLVFAGSRGFVRMLPEISRDNLHEHLAVNYCRPDAEDARIVLVLGGGNVSSIPLTDSLGKLFVDGRVVLLKMHPVNEGLGPVFERALAPLIERGYLQIVYGGAEAGAAAISQVRVDEVHITGSFDTYEAIVWGPSQSLREQRKREGRPHFDKPITSELGNVSPWIIVPGSYSERQLGFQVENIASSVINNASFNCAATKVLITWRQWPDRKRWLERLEHLLRGVPRRIAYYPGAEERFRRFTGRSPEPGEPGTLPWTFICDVDPEESPQFFQEEAFVCVFVEVALNAATEQEFLERAVDFANERLWGTLCATLTVPANFRRGSKRESFFQSQLHRLQYGAVGINQWAGLIYVLASPPWGGSPGGTWTDPHSGTGWVHNAYMLNGIEQTVLEGPLALFPKPISFPTHPRPEPVAWKLLDLYCRPSMRNYLKLASEALRVGHRGR